MGGKPKASNDRLVFVLPRVVVAWLDAEAGRLGVTKSAVMRGATHLFRSQPSSVRGAVVADAEREGGTPLERVEAP
jgi:hypothetical protein